MSGNNETVELNVTGMNCSHCSGSVDRALREMPGVEEVQVLLDEGRATVRGTDLDTGRLIATVDGLGFKAEVRA